MIDPFIAFVLLAVIVAVSIGSAKLVSWCLDRRGESARRSAREAAIVAQARAELASSGWTAEDEAAFQAVRAQQGKHLRVLRPEFQRLFEGAGRD
jgi:TorA maturation chaperone TorD